MTTIPIQLGNISSKTSQTPNSDVGVFYDEATIDYEFWSKCLNMHFGYFRWGKTNPFRRDSMLNEMNHQVLQRLGLLKKKGIMVDLGCGMGSTMKYALEHHKQLSCIGLTLSKFQVQKGNRLLKNRQGVILQENYNNSSLPSNSCDSALAIESFCHSGHHPKSFREAYRLLKPGGRLVIADAFLKKSPGQLSGFAKKGYRRLCSHWSLEKLGAIEEVERQLKNVGFSKVTIEPISWRAAPSVLHVPFAILGFALRIWLNGDDFPKERLHNLKGSFYALCCGLQLKSFGYYLISCTK